MGGGRDSNGDSVRGKREDAMVQRIGGKVEEGGSDGKKREKGTGNARKMASRRRQRRVGEK